MPWNGSGTFARNYSWVQDDANGINITASRMDADTNDIVNNGFGNCLTRDGQGVATANLPMATYRHTGVGNGVARTDYAALGQLQDASIQDGGISTGAAGIFVATLAPPITAYVRGQKFSFTTHQAAAGADTVNFNTVGAKPLVKGNGVAVAANDFGGSQELLVMYDSGGGGRFIVLNTPIAVLNLGVAGTALGAATFSGNTSGTITIQPQSTAGTWNFNLPTTAGVAGQPLVSGGGGSSPMTWGTVTGSGAFVLQTSPVFSGTPTVPTPSVNDNSQTIINSAWARLFVGTVVNLPLMSVQTGLTFNSPGFPT